MTEKRANLLRHDGGFTLIEALVALAILGMASGLLMAGLRAAWIALPVQAQLNRGQEQVMATQRLVRGRIEALIPVPRLDINIPVVDAFGDRNVFSFTAPPLAREAPGAPLRYRLILTSAGDLTLFTASSLNDRIDLRDPSLVGWRPIRLLSGVQELDLAYFGPRSQDGDTVWQSSWQGRTQPPNLVRVRVRFAAGDRRIWSDIVARPRADINAACRVTTRTGRCQQ